jgi:hypothetical protein
MDTDVLETAQAAAFPAFQIPGGTPSFGSVEIAADAAQDQKAAARFFPKSGSARPLAFAAGFHQPASCGTNRNSGAARGASDE